MELDLKGTKETNEFSIILINYPIQLFKKLNTMSNTIFMVKTLMPRKNRGINVGLYFFYSK